ncbi:hypothetical protein T265_10892 [Opisthorchis viverrini]|uniref:Uncharacterized protein n=1 Tax=Opisthorchis viverrini TaxID=6198 RepID=A0A074Z4Y3_OPIVI|nr:hypothetical protein T265_10892 [Opisthorchis viverrini]KER20592.1 hypothetical protein T265_10892 [Opisthorchis viverrini]
MLQNMEHSPGENKAFAVELFNWKRELNSYKLLNREAKLSDASCLQKLNIHLERVFSFTEYLLTITQVSHFSRDAKRIYEKTRYYPHAPVVFIVTLVARVCLLVVDRMAFDPFAELGNWLANVSSPDEDTSLNGSFSCALAVSPRLGTKSSQASCQARRTDQLPSDQPPEQEIFGKPGD